MYTQGLDQQGKPPRGADVAESAERLSAFQKRIDTEEKIEAFLPIIDDAIPEGLVTVERVEIRFYRSREK